MRDPLKEYDADRQRRMEQAAQIRQRDPRSGQTGTVHTLWEL